MIKAYMVNGTDRYVIDFQVQSDRTIKMHCTEHPYDPYGKSVLYNHLYPDGHICVAAGHEPRTMDRAVAIAAAWMEGYSVYIRTGAFPTEAKAYNV